MKYKVSYAYTLTGACIVDAASADKAEQLVIDRPLGSCPGTYLEDSFQVTETTLTHQPDKPNMNWLDPDTWAVCDHCGEWCEPRSGELCWNCGELWDEENAMSLPQICKGCDKPISYGKPIKETMCGGHVHTDCTCHCQQCQDPKCVQCKSPLSWPFFIRRDGVRCASCQEEVTGKCLHLKANDDARVCPQCGQRIGDPPIQANSEDDWLEQAFEDRFLDGNA